MTIVAAILVLIGLAIASSLFILLEGRRRNIAVAASLLVSLVIAGALAALHRTSHDSPFAEGALSIPAADALRFARKEDDRSAECNFSIHTRAGTLLYIGEKKLGNGTVCLTWAQLMGEQGHAPLAIKEVDPDLDTAQALAGAGATVALESPGFELRTGAPGVPHLHASTTHLLIRRADGSLDAVACFDGYWPEEGPSTRFLVPVRAQDATGASINLAGAELHWEVADRPTQLDRPSGTSLRTINIHWRLKAAPPPPEFAEEIQAKGLWQPD